MRTKRPSSKLEKLESSELVEVLGEETMFLPRGDPEEEEDEKKTGAWPVVSPCLQPTVDLDNAKTEEMPQMQAPALAETEAAWPPSKARPKTSAGACPAVPGDKEFRTPRGDTATARSEPWSDADPNALLGQQLGSYRILRCIGLGGMGRVYLAEHTTLNRQVALKLLRPELAADREAVRRFFQEAKAVNKIGHDNIVDITDLVVMDVRRTFIIMELLQGSSLGDILDGLSEPMPLYRTMQIIMQVCDALEASHEVGVVHRDLKPDNIFIVNEKIRRDFVKLLDFGVAKLTGMGQDKISQQTATGAMIGTPAYMSPEQAISRPVDQRSDIYSLGAIIYEMVTGQLVFQGSSIGEYVLMHTNEEPVPPHEQSGAIELPAALEHVILRCLEKAPEDRYQGIAELREALTWAVATEATVIKDNLVEQGKSRPRPRPRIRLPVLGVAAASLVLALLGASLFLRSEDVAPGAIAISPAAGSGGVSSGESLSMEPLQAPAPARVVLTTNPSGAEVYRKGAPNSSLGRTPLLLRLEKWGEEIELVFRLDGHIPASQKIVVADAEMTVTLTPRDPVGRDASTQSPAQRQAQRQAKRQAKTAQMASGKARNRPAPRRSSPAAKSKVTARQPHVQPDEPGKPSIGSAPAPAKQAPPGELDAPKKPRSAGVNPEKLLDPFGAQKK